METSKFIPKGYRHESFVRKPQMRKSNNFSPSKLKPRRHMMDPMGYKHDSSATKFDYKEHLATQQKLSVSALQKHIKLTHPKNVSDKSDADNWSIFEQIGSLTKGVCCVKRKISDVSYNLGLGASLQLLSLKAYIKLFFVLTIFSIAPAIILTSGD